MTAMKTHYLKINYTHAQKIAKNNTITGIMLS